MIKPKHGKFQLMTHTGSRALGPVTTKEKALAQERAIKASEARRGKPRPKK